MAHPWRWHTDEHVDIGPSNEFSTRPRLPAREVRDLNGFSVARPVTTTVF